MFSSSSCSTHLHLTQGLPLSPAEAQTWPWFSACARQPMQTPFWDTHPGLLCRGAAWEWLPDWQELAACSGIRFSVKKMSFQNHQSVFGLADMLCLESLSLSYHVAWLNLISNNITEQKTAGSLTYSTFYGSVTIFLLVCFVGLVKQNCKDLDPTFINHNYKYVIRMSGNCPPLSN